MALSTDLVRQFVKITNDDTTKENSGTVKGTVNIQSGVIYVLLDGAEITTPVSTTVDVSTGDRVNVEVKDHTATIVGSVSSPSGKASDVATNSSKMSTFDNALAYSISTTELSAFRADIDQLSAKIATITDLTAEQITAITAEINTLYAKTANIDKLTVTDLSAINASIDIINTRILNASQAAIISAEIGALTAYTGKFAYLSADNLSAIHADIDDLDVEKADIDFANIIAADISSAKIKELLVQSGIITTLDVSQGYVAKLIAVEINADLINAGTLTADRLLLKARDGEGDEKGLYYQLNTNGVEVTTEEVEYDDTNSINGKIIAAKTIGAEKISVQDLVAFDARIGGFKIGQDSLYSGIKDSVDQASAGIYLDSEGQISIGDDNQHIKYYAIVDPNDPTQISRKLEIVADNIMIKAPSGSDISISDKIDELSGSISGVDGKIKDAVSGVNSIVDTVKTEKGYEFSNDGFKITAKDNELGTTITNNGMTVTRNTEPVLTANADGVDAVNLHASTYLIIGENSRLEEYVSNSEQRTGCFWIGG